MNQQDLDPQFDAEDPFATPADPEADEEIRKRQRESLQTMISARLRRSYDARMTSGIEEIWQEDDDLYNGIEYGESAPDRAPNYWAGKRSSPEKAKTKSRIYVNIVKPKTDTYVARVTELLIPHDDRPWEIAPTPVPELSEAVENKDQRPITLADGTTRPAEQVAQALMFKAEEASKKMASQIEDWFVEGHVYSQWRRVVHDAGRIGTGCIKGPIPVNRKDRKWRNVDGVSTIEMVQRLAPTAVAKSVWDVFPDPSCGENIHNGSWLFDRDYLTGRSLRELAGLPDYDSDAIAQILKEGPRAANSRTDNRYDREKPGQTSTFESDTFEVFYYYGDIPPETLISGGWEIQGLIDAGEDVERAKQIDNALQLTTVPVVVTMVNERIVRVSMNPLETGDFPIDLFVIEPVEGQPWGRSVGRKMAPAQKMLNGATRAMLENAGLSSGAQIVIDRERIQPANGVYEIVGKKLWYWTPGDEVKDVRFAFQAVTIPTAQVELQNIIKFALEMADQLSNLPMMMQGDMGAAPDTVGGMAMLEGNAMSPLKVTAKAYDDCLVVPQLDKFYAWGMQDPNVPAECKGDMQTKARGSSALVQRDLYATVLPQLMPFVKDPAFGLDPEKYILELLRSNKLNPSSLRMTDEQIKAQQQQMAQNPPVDPKIQAAQIAAESKAQALQADIADRQQARAQDAQENQADREHEKLLADIDFQIQAMEFAGQKDITFEQLRAMLATKAMELKNKRELFAAERQFAETDGGGRGL